MTVALAPQATRQPEAATRLEDHARGGLRRWTPGEYHRLKLVGFFSTGRIELLNGLLWHPEEPEPRRWTREEYHRLADLGFFDDERVELLDGRVWSLPPQKTPHFTAVRRTTEALERLFGRGHEVRAQGPLLLPDGGEPEPDVLVVPGTPEDYAERHPDASEVLLLVEVSDRTLRKDTGPKRVAYARAGVEEYWVVDLVHRRLEVGRGPSPEGVYDDLTVYLPGEPVTPLAAPGKTVPVADLLPPVKQDTEP